MKKLLSILIALTMVLTLAGCGAGSSEPNKDPATTIATEQTPDIQPLELLFEPAVEIYENIVNGDTSDMEKTMPAEMWEAIADEYATTRDEMVSEYKDAYSALLGDIFISAELEIVSYEVADDKIEDIKALLLSNYDIDFNIKAVYEVTLEGTYEVSEEYKDQMNDDSDIQTVYAINIGDAWYLLDEIYEWRILM